MKKTKIIVPAMGLLLLGTAASVTSTVAWFSANNRVTISGMTASTQVKGNLLICDDNVEANYSASNFNEPVDGILEPVSSINGVNFFYTKEEVKGTGATTDATLETYSNQSTFASYYGVVGSDAYVDYTFYLKATSDEDGQKVAITKFNMLYNGSAMGSEKAWRVAVFAQEVSEGGSGSIGTLKSIVAPASATYFTSGQAYNSATTKAAVSNLSQPANIGTITNKGTTQRYYVVVRLFLEGEDTTCKNDTFAELTEDYSLNLVCELIGSAQDGAASIASQRAAHVTKAGLVATVAKDADGLNENLTAYQWQKKSAGVWGDISNANEASYTGVANDVLRCKVTTESGSVYFSDTVTLEAQYPLRFFKQDRSFDRSFLLPAKRV